ncbi:MAG: LysR family transcriptional regulator [Janthinobacterium lividum]
MITHRHVEVFRAVMLTGSVTKAAELLRTSQPTVSRELARVEQVFGFCLFDRSQGRLRPTHSALSLYEEVMRSYVGLERINACVMSLRRREGSELSAIALPVFAHSLLPGTCKRLLASHPAASISITSQESPFLEQWLSAQRYDIGLTEHDVAPVGTYLTPLLDVDEVCVLPDGHPLLDKDVIELADFDGHAYVSFPATDPYRVQIDSAFAAMGVERRMVAETPSAVSVCNMVRNGLGVTIINPLTALDFEGRNLHIRSLSVSYSFRVSVVVPEHRPTNPLSEPFIQALRSEATSVQHKLATLFDDRRSGTRR